MTPTDRARDYATRCGRPCAEAGWPWTEAGWRLVREDDLTKAFAAAMAEAAADALAARPAWQPIETAPKDGALILLTDGAQIRIARWSDDSLRWIDYVSMAAYGFGGPFDLTPTLWAPMPKLPVTAPEVAS